MDRTNLTEVFQEAIDCFNDPYRNNQAVAYTALGGLFHPDIEMVEVDDTQAVHTGKSPVLTYLQTKQAIKLPQFNRDATLQNVGGQNGGRGLITGKGTFQDSKATSTNPFPVVYSFAFERDASNNCLLKRAYAVPV